jgi:TPR repeat protein
VRRAADQGHLPAQFQLGRYYVEGKGVPLDLARAYRWFFLAARDGHKEAAIERDKITGALTAEQMKEAKQRIAEFTPKRME